MADYTIRSQGAARATETDLDTGASGGGYHLDLVRTDWGVAQQSPAAEDMTQDGSVLWLPSENAWPRRTIKVCGMIECLSLAHKIATASAFAQLVQGYRTLRRQGMEIDVWGCAPVEIAETKATWAVYGYEVAMYATPPFWRTASTLSGFQFGDGLIYPDMGVPPVEAMPAYIFGYAAGATALTNSNPGAGSPHFSMTNWGTAPAWPTFALTGGPTTTAIYVRGVGPYRVKVTTDGAGAATMPETSRFYLAPGVNAIRFENSAGTALNLASGTYPSLKIDFSASQFRYL